MPHVCGGERGSDRSAQLLPHVDGNMRQNRGEDLMDGLARIVHHVIFRKERGEEASFPFSLSFHCCLCMCDVCCVCVVSCIRLFSLSLSPFHSPFHVCCTGERAIYYPLACDTGSNFAALPSTAIQATRRKKVLNEERKRPGGDQRIVFRVSSCDRNQSRFLCFSPSGPLRACIMCTRIIPGLTVRDRERWAPGHREPLSFPVIHSERRANDFCAILRLSLVQVCVRLGLTIVPLSLWMKNGAKTRTQ